jgi:hypothetical protein
MGGIVYTAVRRRRPGRGSGDVMWPLRAKLKAQREGKTERRVAKLHERQAASRGSYTSTRARPRRAPPDRCVGCDMARAATETAHRTIARWCRSCHRTRAGRRTTPTCHTRPGHRRGRGRTDPRTRTCRGYPGSHRRSRAAPTRPPNRHGCRACSCRVCAAEWSGSACRPVADSRTPSRIGALRSYRQRTVWMGWEAMLSS